MRNDTECWCHKTHAEPPEDFAEAVTALNHLLIAKARIPEMVDWLNRRLSR